MKKFFDRNQNYLILYIEKGIILDVYVVSDYIIQISKYASIPLIREGKEVGNLPEMKLVKPEHFDNIGEILKQARTLNFRRFH